MNMQQKKLKSNMTLQEKIKRLKKDFGITQRMIAQKLGAYPQNINEALKDNPTQIGLRRKIEKYVLSVEKRKGLL